eukprot:5268174-Pleurochrysis_carterae.AAC.1
MNLNSKRSGFIRALCSVPTSFDALGYPRANAVFCPPPPANDGVWEGASGALHAIKLSVWTGNLCVEVEGDAFPKISSRRYDPSVGDCQSGYARSNFWQITRFYVHSSSDAQHPRAASVGLYGNMHT